MPNKLLPAVLAALLVFAACNTNEKSLAAEADLEQLPAIEQPATPTMAADEQAPIQAAGDSSPASSVHKPAAADWDKKIIRTATLTLEVKQVKDYNNALREKLEQHGAYTANEENIFAADKSAIEVTIKVPVQQFSALMNELVTKDSKLINRSVKAEDVSAQLADVKSRLQAKKEVRARYLELLKQSKNMAEILQVQTEINNIQEEMEVATGRMQFLATQSAYSTIHLNFYEPLPGFRPGNEEPTFVTRLLGAMADGGGIFKSIILALVTVWPLLLLVFIGSLFWRRRSSSHIGSPAA